MMRSASERFGALSTAAKLLLILTAVLLPIGVGLMWIAQAGIREANATLEGRSEDLAEAASRGVESLIARNALALRIAANGALADGQAAACQRAQRSLSIAPAVAQRFQLDDVAGRQICAVGAIPLPDDLPLVAPGDIRLRIAADRQSLIVRVGVVEGMATGLLSMEEIREAAIQRSGAVAALTINDADDELEVIEQPRIDDRRSMIAFSQWPIGNGELAARIGTPVPRITTGDRLVLLLPLLMWVLAALVTWLLLNRLLIRPLRLLQRAVSRYQPGEGSFQVPRKLGPATEIQELRGAFGRALARVDESEREMAAALDGQRRLVREVHHRVKNNLQVIASLLNIHGRTAETPEARAAYAAIGRRVGALSIVHRNHFAEMEENRGIAIRPLLTELAAELRAGAPEAARGLTIELDVESAYTTQDVAVSIAFLVTEIVEFAMLHCPSEPVEVSLRRTSELTARLAVSSPVLVPEEDKDPTKVQFERIVTGLAKQLRSNLERKLGRYTVDLPVFPAA